MITYNTSTDDTIKELNEITRTCLNRVSGLRKKYKKKLLDPKIPDNAILGTLHYVIQENKVTVVAIKQNVQVGSKTISEICISLMVETGKGFLIPQSTASLFSQNNVFFQFTAHSIYRMKQRLGLDIYDFFREEYVVRNYAAYQLKEYNRNGNPNEYICQMGDGFLICEAKDGGKRMVVKTILNKDDLYASQLQQFLDSKVERENNTSIQMKRGMSLMGCLYQAKKIKSTKQLINSY